MQNDHFFAMEQEAKFELWREPSEFIIFIGLFYEA